MPQCFLLYQRALRGAHTRTHARRNVGKCNTKCRGTVRHFAALGVLAVYEFADVVQQDLPVAPVQPVAPVPPPPSATILRHCRCQDCMLWHARDGYCRELGFRRYVPRHEYHPAMQQFWTDIGTIRPDEWHYCAYYDGPQVSKDVWVWR